MQIAISTKNFELTSEIEEYIDKKINSVTKFYGQVVRAHVVLGRETNHHQKGDIYFAEAKFEVSGGEIFGKQSGESVEQAIDALKDYLEIEFKKYKAKQEKHLKVAKKDGREQKEYQMEE